MKNIIVAILIGLLVIGGLIGLSYAFGWIGVHQTATIGKEMQNAKRKNFEQSQSYVEGKRQEALKFYREYQTADEIGKSGIKEMVAHSFAQFDENLLEGRVKSFVVSCKYNE